MVERYRLKLLTREKRIICLGDQEIGRAWERRCEAGKGERERERGREKERERQRERELERDRERERNRERERERQRERERERERQRERRGRYYCDGSSCMRPAAVASNTLTLTHIHS